MQGDARIILSHALNRSDRDAPFGYGAHTSRDTRERPCRHEKCVIASNRGASKHANDDPKSLAWLTPQQAGKVIDLCTKSGIFVCKGTILHAELIELSCKSRGISKRGTKWC